MKKVVVVLVALLVSLSSFTDSQMAEEAIPNNAFESGETLKYLLFYGWIHGGHATLTVNKLPIEGMDVYHAKATCKTIGWADKLYKVNDIYESFFDSNTGRPLKSIRNISEREYRYYDEVKYNHRKNQVETQRKGTVAVPKNTFDIVSAFYYSRRTLINDQLKPGDTIRMDTYFDDGIFPVVATYKGKEVIETKAGKFKAMKFSPKVEPGRIFDSEDDLKFWVSDDPNHLLLRVQFDLMVGSLKCDLIEYSGTKNALKRLD